MRVVEVSDFDNDKKREEEKCVACTEPQLLFVSKPH